MNLDEAQKKTVAAWIKEGMKLSDIQKRIATELGVSLTYMEVRFLVDDLRLTPKDVEPLKVPDLGLPDKGSPPPNAPAQPAKEARLQPEKPAPAGSVSVSVDQIARPGTVASGKVTFSDGNAADWYLDQMGRLGLMPLQQGYRPSQQDVQLFQAELQNELARFGL